MKNSSIDLPQNLGIWSRAEAVKKVTSQNIFDYMNGAGELYLAYHFDHLEVLEYSVKKQQNILVELYFMKSSDDAYGLLSQDWGGEPQNLDLEINRELPENKAPRFRALYGKGLLRIWSNNLYARVLAFLETPVSKKAVLELGRLIVAGRKNTLPPELLNVLPAGFGPHWKVREKTITYFRSHLVLNSIYFLSHQNILNLNHSTEACYSEYEKHPRKGKRNTFHLLFVRYSSAEKAQVALNQFADIYLPEYKKKQPDSHFREIKKIFKIEDGWMGYKLEKKLIICVFGCPDKDTSRMVLETTENLAKEE
jgi:hypothetical protein